MRFHLSSTSVGFCFLCSNVGVASDKLIPSLLQGTVVLSQEGLQVPCTVGHQLQDASTRTGACCREQHPRGLWECDCGQGHPPWGSLPSIPFLTILPNLSAIHLWDQSSRWGERRAGGRQSSAVLCHDWKAQVQPWVTSTRCRTQHKAVNNLPGLGAV